MAVFRREAANLCIDSDFTEYRQYSGKEDADQDAPSCLLDRCSNVASLEVANGWGAYHPFNCNPAEVEELARIARGPPAGLHVLKYGSRSVVGLFATEKNTTVCLKYYFPKHLAKHLRYGIWGSRCHQSWAAALAFRRCGIPTPDPLVVIERKRLAGCWLDVSFLATRKGRGIPLRDLIAEDPSAKERLERIARNLRDAFAKMARHRIIHGDLKATNILVDENDQISFIDLDAAAVIRSARPWRQLRARDERIFAANWREGTCAAEIFHGLFDSLPESVCESCPAPGLLT